MSFGYQVLGFGSGGALGPFDATGGTETTYGLYTVHSFTSNGTFQITSGEGDIDVLIVGAGGGGGGTLGGGAGAGGLITMAAQTVGVASYAIVIGAGGSGGAGNYAGTNGNDTTGFGQNCSGGGYGAPYTVNASEGGCGGGGAGGLNGSPAPGSASDQTAVQSPWSGTAYGTDGGTGLKVPASHAGAGGGGAGGAGVGASSVNAAGAGGLGLQNLYQTGVNQYYAAGGGGGCWQGSAGAGGTGGGGAGTVGNASSTAPAGTTYGSGGGGNGGQSKTGGAGYDGVTVIRYVTPT